MHLICKIENIITKCEMCIQSLTGSRNFCNNICLSFRLNYITPQKKNKIYLFEVSKLSAETICGTVKILFATVTTNVNSFLSADGFDLATGSFKNFTYTF